MKVVICVFAFAAVVLAHPEDKYTEKYDNTNIDEVLDSKRLVAAYVSCWLEEPQAKCTTEAKEIKSRIPDALQTDCSKCSETQRAGVEKVIKHLMNHNKEDWAKLSAKYDPDGIYTKKNQARLATYA